MKSSNYSFLFSLALHIIVIALTFVINYNSNFEEDDIVTIGFGTITGSSESTKKTFPSQSIEKQDDLDLPVSQSSFDNISSEDNKSEISEKQVRDIDEISEADDYANDYYENSEQAFGYKIDFGNAGKRKIYNFVIPPYPEDVSKEIDVKLRFTILPDGSIGTIIPLVKADARLEDAAISSLRKWRFEPLPGHKKQTPQNAVITFPFRLK